MPIASGSQEDGHRVRGRRRRPGSAAAVDPVTALPDRNNVLTWAEEAIERSRARSKLAVVAFADIGLLRDVNDAFGADAGDYLLRAIGARLATIDLPGTHLARYGGAEFVLVFEGIDSVEMAGTVGQFLVELLTPGFALGSEEVAISPTVGLAVSSDRQSAAAELIGDAHRALVRARDAGQGGWEVHDDTRRGRYDTRIDETRLATAIDNREFVLAYQPIVRLDTGETIGFEALIRWRAPNATTTGMLLPRDFMPLLEKTGMSVRVGHWVIEEACRQIGEWSRRFDERPPLFVTCNVGARQLASVDFLPRVLGAVAETGIQPWQLCLDITEEALQFNRTAAWGALRELKDRGVKLGLDDFGTGVSSLTYLREFTLDVLRVDRTFVENITLSREDQAIVRHVTGLAHELGLVVVAEGVESDDQLAHLRAAAVDLAQGYRFGRPVFANEAVARLDPTARPEAWSPGDVTHFKRGDW